MAIISCGITSVAALKIAVITLEHSTRPVQSEQWSNFPRIFSLIVTLGGTVQRAYEPGLFLLIILVSFSSQVMLSSNLKMSLCQCLGNKCKIVISRTLEMM